MSASIIIIGAGMTGITAASRLHQAGFSTTIIEKSRGIGGRLATRRTRQGFAFDHGAQFISPRDPNFQTWLNQAAANGHAAIWQPSSAEPSPHPWYTGQPGMNGLLRSAAEPLNIQTDTTITSISTTGQSISLTAAETSIKSQFDGLILTAPVPQTAKLLAPLNLIDAATNTAIADQLAKVAMAPCWALLLAFDQPLNLDADVWRSKDTSHPLAWAARNNSKPGRNATPECWIIHASPAWSITNLERTAEDIAPELFALFQTTIAPNAPAPTYQAAHRWRYAMTTQPLGTPFLRAATSRIWAGGDWALGPRVEAAYLSGQAIAEDVIKQFS